MLASATPLCIPALSTQMNVPSNRKSEIHPLVEVKRFSLPTFSEAMISQHPLFLCWELINDIIRHQLAIPWEYIPSFHPHWTFMRAVLNNFFSLLLHMTFTIKISCTPLAGLEVYLVSKNYDAVEFIFPCTIQCSALVHHKVHWLVDRCLVIPIRFIFYGSLI